MLYDKCNILDTTHFSVQKTKDIYFCTFTGKRKANNVQVLESRKIAGEQKEKRHKEKMEAKHKLLEKLDKLIDKL